MLVVFITIIFFISVPVMAKKTPDGMTPSIDTVCDDAGLFGAAWGLCNAYCEAMDCDSDATRASDKACDNIFDKIVTITGEVPPCENLCPDDFNPDQVDLDGDGIGDECDTSIVSTISITGPETITDTSPSMSTDSVFFAIVVKNESNVPLNDVVIWITYPWAVPAPAGLTQLYDGDIPKDSPMSVTTDSNGTFILRMDYVRGGGASYTGTLEVKSGSIVGTAEFSVSSE
jgi:hypothetical protein